MLKKSWVLLLVLTALLVPCSAIASPIDGTWRIESGTIEILESGNVVMTASIIISTVEPSEFPIQIVEGTDGLYSMIMNNDVGVKTTWRYIYPNGSIAEEHTSMSSEASLERISDTKYQFTEDDWGEWDWVENFIELSDPSTLKGLNNGSMATPENGVMTFSQEVIFKRVGGGGGGNGNGGGGNGGGGNGGGSGDGESSDGCNAGLGVLALALMFSAAGITRRR